MRMGCGVYYNHNGVLRQARQVWVTDAGGTPRKVYDTTGGGFSLHSFSSGNYVGYLRSPLTGQIKSMLGTNDAVKVGSRSVMYIYDDWGTNEFAIQFDAAFDGPGPGEPPAPHFVSVSLKDKTLLRSAATVTEAALTTEFRWAGKVGLQHGQFAYVTFNS